MSGYTEEVISMEGDKVKLSGFDEDTYCFYLIRSKGKTKNKFMYLKLRDYGYYSDERYFNKYRWLRNTRDTISLHGLVEDFKIPDNSLFSILYPEIDYKLINRALDIFSGRTYGSMYHGINLYELEKH